jgi:DNA topoisomerase VI subunit B
MTATLERTTFEMNRELEFFTENELAPQMGVDRPWWPLALLKELIDNSLDACEAAGIAPVIEVELEDDAITVQDNGAGLPVETLERSLDYLVRVSDKAHYVSPSRGQLGNALKCVWAAPYVACGEDGAVEVTTGGITHRIAVTVDRIAERPVVVHTEATDGFVKFGTRMRLIWPSVASYLAATSTQRFYKSARQLIGEYAAFNPHASFRYRERREEGTWAVWEFGTTTEGWRKWSPRDLTSAH